MKVPRINGPTIMLASGLYFDLEDPAASDELYSGWRRVDVSTHADGARDRTESLWLSRGCPQAELFDTPIAPPRPTCGEDAATT